MMVVHGLFSLINFVTSSPLNLGKWQSIRATDGVQSQSLPDGLFTILGFRNNDNVWILLQDLSEKCPDNRMVVYQ